MTILARNKQTLSSGEYRSEVWSEPGTTRDEQMVLSIPQHLAPVVFQLQELLALDEGWNSYRARRVRPAAVIAALELLADSNWSGTLPSVSPTPKGGVKYEWGGDEDGVEIEFSPEGSVTVLVDVNGEMWEHSIRSHDDYILYDALTWAEKLS